MGKKILICDDDRDIVEVTSLILRDDGYEVKAVYTSDNILEEVKEYTPDLVLMDLRVPRKGGEEATKEIKQDKKTREIPILVFSANHEAVKISKEIGADGFVSKPYDIDIFLEIIKHSIK
ncbi:MAG TPA: response regulator [Ignavibacteria bacterium]|nr:response regulator [Ignavibacteria bacterium]